MAQTGLAGRLAATSRGQNGLASGGLSIQKKAERYGAMADGLQEAELSGVHRLSKLKGPVNSLGLLAPCPLSLRELLGSFFQIAGVAIP
jgi:hypothetical protein